MTNMPFDSRDQAAMRALDSDVELTLATISGRMTLKLTRPADERYLLEIELPGEEQFPILLSRAKTLEQLNVEGSES